jgi:CBS domain-containing protein
MTSIGQVMTSKLHYVNADSSAFQAAREMQENSLSSVLIIHGGKIVGILTERDLVRQICAKDLLASKTHVISIMSSPLITINKDESVEKAAKMMVKNKVRHLGVENHDHQIIGIITTTDLTKYLMNSLQTDDNTQQLLKSLYWLEEPSEEIDI